MDVKDDEGFLSGVAQVAGEERFSHGEAAEHCGNGNVIRHRSSWSVVVPLAVVPWMVIGQSCVSAPMEICSEGSIGDMLGRLRKHSRKKEERTQAAMCEGHVQDMLGRLRKQSQDMLGRLR